MLKLEWKEAKSNSGRDEFHGYFGGCLLVKVVGFPDWRPDFNIHESMSFPWFNQNPEHAIAIADTYFRKTIRPHLEVFGDQRYNAGLEAAAKLIEETKAEKNIIWDAYTPGVAQVIADRVRGLKKEVTE